MTGTSSNHGMTSFMSALNGCDTQVVRGQVDRKTRRGVWREVTQQPVRKCGVGEFGGDVVLKAGVEAVSYKLTKGLHVTATVI
jgi:hypothetical protein